MARRGENIRKRKDGRWEGRYIKARTPEGMIQWGYVYGTAYAEVTLYRSKPFFSCIWAKVWRQVCGLTRTEGDTPTSFAACFSIRATASSVKSFPFLLRNRFLWRLGYSFK